MKTRNLHPGRELIQCHFKIHGFYPRAAGCSICRMARRAEQLAAQRFDNGPAASGGSTPANGPHPVAAAGPASRESLSDLIARESELTERAIQRATATVASIDRALSDDEQRRKASHEAAALEQVGRAIFDALCGARSRSIANSAFELEAPRFEVVR